jgi:hypothetical protein
MTTGRRVLTGVLLAGVLGTAAALPVRAGYGNHAERATANIQTRIGIEKVSLLTQVAQFKVVQAQGGLPQP